MLSRRDFLKLLATVPVIVSVAMPKTTYAYESIDQGSTYVNVDSMYQLELSDVAQDILAKTVDLGFDEQGNLIFEDTEERLHLIQSEFNKRHLGEDYKMKEPKLFVIHYDAGSKYCYYPARSAEVTLRWLNDASRNYPSAQWIADSYPIRTADSDEFGYGILQTHVGAGDSLQYKGKHVSVNRVNIDGQPEFDYGVQRTFKFFERFGIESNFVNLLKGKEDELFSMEPNIRLRYLDNYSLGVEQPGTKFDEIFSEYPDTQQIANILSLTLAVMDQYKLGPYDVIGHHEIQSKGDPGDLHMAELRFLIGVAALEGMIDEDIVFADYISPAEYFTQLEEYFMARDNHNNHPRWLQRTGYRNFMISLEDYLDRQTNRRKLEKKFFFKLEHLMY